MSVLKNVQQILLARRAGEDRKLALEQEVRRQDFEKRDLLLDGGRHVFGYGMSIDAARDGASAADIYVDGAVVGSIQVSKGEYIVRQTSKDLRTVKEYEEALEAIADIVDAALKDLPPRAH